MRYAVHVYSLGSFNALRKDKGKTEYHWFHFGGVEVELENVMNDIRL